MPYATSEKLAAECRLGTADFTTNTNPTKARVEEMILEEEAKIDARLGQKYVLPISDTAALAVLCSISLAILSARVRKITEVMTGDRTIEQDPYSKGASDAWKQLECIMDGSMTLPGSPQVGTGKAPVCGPKKRCRPKFTRERDQW